MKIKNLLLAILTLPLIMVACEPNNPVDEVKDPTVAVTAGEATESTIAFTVVSTDAEKVAYLVVEGTEAPTASEVLANGTAVEANKSVELTASELKAETEYTIVAAAQNSKAVVKASATKATLKANDEPGPEPGPTDTWVASHFYADFDDSEGINMYAIMLGDKDFGNSGWGVDGGTYYTIYFVSATKGGGKLPKGTYVLDDSYSAGTIIIDYSYRHTMENGQLKYGMEIFKEANLIISDGKVELNAVMDRDDSVVKAVYEGDLSVKDGGSQQPSEFEATHVADKWYWGGSSNYGNKYMVAGEGFSVDVHFQSKNATETAIVAGEYTWTTTTMWGYNDFEEFTTRTFTVDGTSVAVDSGKAVVSNEGDEYHIEMTLMGRDGFNYMIEYNGKLNDKDDVGGEDNTLVVNTLGEGTYNSSYYFYAFKAEGENFSFDLVVNDYQAAATRINAGSYTCASSVSYAGNENLFYVNNFKYDGISYKPTEASTMTVEGDGTNVVITMDLTMQSGDKFAVTYDGKIGDSAGEVELTKLATPSVSGIVSGNAATISWNEIAGAKDYTVTLNGTEVQTVTTAYVVYQDLAYSTTYTVEVVANPADATVNAASDAGTASFTTEADPNGGNEGGNEGGSTTQSYENWVFSAALDMGAKTITVTDGTHTVVFTLNEVGGGKFYIFDNGVFNIVKVVVDGIETTDASGTVEMSTNNSYYITLDATINGVRYTGTSTNPVV